MFTLQKRGVGKFVGILAFQKSKGIYKKNLSNVQECLAGRWETWREEAFSAFCGYLVFLGRFLYIFSIPHNA